MLGRETWILLVTVAATASAAAAIAWYLRDHKREPEDVTIGFVGPSLAAMYLLVLALALATEWQTIGSAQQAVGNEAVAVRQVYWAASGLPPAAGNTLRAQIRGYVATVIDHDWPEMERGTLDDASLKLLTAMSTSLLEVSTQTSRAANAQAYATGQLGALVTSRAQRAERGREPTAGRRAHRGGHDLARRRRLPVRRRNPLGPGIDQRGRRAGRARRGRRRRRVPAEQLV